MAKSTVLNQLAPHHVKLMMLQAAEAIIAAEPVLSQADRDLGDGDHGLGMKRGMEAVKEKLADLDSPTIERVFVVAGSAMMATMGGASGALFGTLFRSGGKALAGDPCFDTESLTLFLREALRGVVSRGNAKVGDKTMVDALAPAAAKAEEMIGRPLADSLQAVVEAAEAGKEASKDMIAQFGRAKTLGQGCLGFPDAGALSVTVILNAMNDFVRTID